MSWVINFDNGKGPCRVNQASASVGYFIFSFGGYCQQQTINQLKHKSPIDVNVLNTLTFKWHKRPIPNEAESQYDQTPYFRYGHTCVSYTDHIYLWGGRADFTDNLCNDLFLYKPSKHIWNIIQTNTEKPDGRDGHSACVVKDSMYIFGGYVQKTKKFSNDMYQFDFLTSTWTLITPKNELRPFWRDFHTSTAVGENIFIFGGRMDVGRERFTGESFYSNDLYAFNTKKNIWREVRPDTSNSQNDSTVKFSPCGRRSHSAVAYKNKIILFGGFQENIRKHYNDLYEFDIDKNEWKLLSPTGKTPWPRRRHSCCVMGTQLFIFGGTGPSPDANAQNRNPNLIVPASLRNDADIDNLILENLNQVNRLFLRFERTLNNLQNARQNNQNNPINLNALIGGWQRLGIIANSINPPLPLPQLEYQEELREFDEELEENQNENEQVINRIENNQFEVDNDEAREEMAQEEHVPQHVNLNELPYVDNEDVQFESRNEINNNNDEALVRQLANNVIHNENENNNNNNNVPVNEIDEELVDYESDSDDFINEELEDYEDDEDDERSLISLSDLHVLELDVSSLRSLSIQAIIKNSINFYSLPQDLIFQIECLKNK